MRDLLFAIVFPSLLVPALVRPWLAVLVWVWIDYMSPHRLCYTPYIYWQLPVAMIAAAVTFISVVIANEPKRFPITRETVVLLMFIGWMSFTTMFALNGLKAQETWEAVMKIQVLVLVTAVVMRDAWRLKLLVWTIALSLGFYGVKGGLFTILKGGAHRVYGPDQTFIADNNDVALVLVAVLPLLRFLMLSATQRLLRWGLGGAIVLTGAAVLGTYSRGGIIGLAVVTLLMIWKSRRRLLFTLILVVGGLLTVPSMPDAWFERMNTIQEYEKDGSVMGRFNAWHFALNVAADRPLTGGGFDVFTPALFRHYAPNPEDYHAAHNIFLRVLAEHGYPGLGLFLLLGFLTWRSATWIRRATRGIAEMTWAGDLASMIQVSLAGYAVGGSLLNLAYFDLPYHLMIIVVVCKILVRQHLQGTAARQEAEAVPTGLQEQSASVA